MKYRKFDDRWVFENRGVYFSFTVDELREMETHCKDILDQLANNQGVATCAPKFPMEFVRTEKGEPRAMLIIPRIGEPK